MPITITHIFPLFKKNVDINHGIIKNYYNSFSSWKKIELLKCWRNWRKNRWRHQEKRVDLFCYFLQKKKKKKKKTTWFGRHVFSWFVPSSFRLMSPIPTAVIIMQSTTRRKFCVTDFFLFFKNKKKYEIELTPPKGKLFNLILCCCTLDKVVCK